jgi:hypothetical protein
VRVCVCARVRVCACALARVCVCGPQIPTLSLSWPCCPWMPQHVRDMHFTAGSVTEEQNQRKNLNAKLNPKP